MMDDFPPLHGPINKTNGFENISESPKCRLLKSRYLYNASKGFMAFSYNFFSSRSVISATRLMIFSVSADSSSSFNNCATWSLGRSSDGTSVSCVKSSSTGSPLSSSSSLLASSDLLASLLSSLSFSLLSPPSVSLLLLSSSSFGFSASNTRI